MLRTYVAILVLAVFAATLVARIPGASAPSTTSVITVGDKDAASASARDEQSKAQSVDALDKSIELTRDENGYFYADVEINGAPVHMLVDTGASIIALSRDDARTAGIATSIGMNEVVGQGADGAVKGEQVMLSRVSLGSRTVEALPAIVLNSGGQSLLGQSFLSKFSSVKIEGNKMVLR